jgi:2-phospho-L-lactate guanylyltransferase
MPVYAVIPVKVLSESKIRLSVTLTLQERRTLTLTMVEDVLKALRSSKACHICMISSDMSIRALAERFDVAYLSERQKGLNQAIGEATEWCMRKNAKAVLVVPADVPLITSEDVNRMIDLGSDDGSVVISPSLDGGTNALLRKPPNMIPVHFGPNSFKKHFNEAQERGVSAKLYHSERVALDIDSLEDLKRFSKVESETMTHKFLEQIRLDERVEWMHLG